MPPASSPTSERRAPSAVLQLQMSNHECGPLRQGTELRFREPTILWKSFLRVDLVDSYAMIRGSGDLGDLFCSDCARDHVKVGSRMESVECFYWVGLR